MTTAAIETRLKTNFTQQQHATFSLLSSLLKIAGQGLVKIHSLAGYSHSSLYLYQDIHLRPLKRS